MEKNKEKRKRIILIAIIIVLSFIIIILLLPKKTTKGGIKWNEQGVTKTNNSIEIAAFNSLHFKAGQIKQEVKLNNPKSNHVDMIMTIKIDDYVLWESDKVSPDYGFTEIEINKPLEKGEYKAQYIVRCFKPDGEEVNGGTVSFTIYAQ